MRNAWNFIVAHYLIACSVHRVLYMITRMRSEYYDDFTMFSVSISTLFFQKLSFGVNGLAVDVEKGKDMVLNVYLSMLL